MEAVVGNQPAGKQFDSRNTRQKGTCIMANNNTYTLKSNPAKYDNLHTCDQKYWAFTADWSKAQDLPALEKSLTFVTGRLTNIVKAKAFKPENIKSAKDLLALVKTEVETIVANSKAGKLDLAVESFKCYQLERFTFRLWYRDTKAAREATEPKPARQEKPKTETKTPAKKSTSKTPAKAKAKAETPAKQDTPNPLGKMTKAQKKELVLALLSELLK